MILRIRIVFLVALAVLSLTGALYEPTNLSCASLNSTTLMFSWTLPASGIFTVNGYHLNLQRTDNIRVENIPHVDTGSVYVENYTYYKIGKYAEYTLTMHSYTASGNDTDVSVTCRTDEDAPDGGPPSVNSTGISYTEISVIWTEPPRYHHNGILLGYKLVYHAYLSQFPQEVVLSNTSFAYTITGLEYDTWYVISVLPYTTVGDGPRTSYPEKTLGPTTKAPEEVTKYYCYEAIPGTLVFSWESMPCTIYVGVIGALFLFLLMALVACCCKGSKKIKEKHTSNVQMMPPVIHLKEKVKVIQAMNKFKKNRKGGENGTNDNRDMDYNGNSFGRGVSNSFTNNFGDGNPKVRPGRGGNDYDVGEDDGRGKRKGLWGMGLNNLLGKGREGSKDKLVDDRQDPYGDPECSRWNSGRSKQRGDPFDIRAGKNAATASALRARGKKNNTVSPLNFDDEGYYDDDGDEYGDDSGDLTARDIRLFSKQPSKNSNPDIARRGSKKGNTTVPVLDKRFNRDISGVDLYLEDNDDNYDDEYFEHPPPAPRFHLGDDASVDLPFGGEGVGLKGGIPLGADGDDAAFF